MQTLDRAHEGTGRVGQIHQMESSGLENSSTLTWISEKIG